MSFQGDIASLPISDVFQNLLANKKTGTLTVRLEDSREIYVQFVDGSIVSYHDSDGFSIARWLLDKAIVDADSTENALKRYRRAKKKTFGQILHDLGALEFEAYEKYVRYLVSECLYELLSLREGALTFKEGDLDSELGSREVRALGLQIAPSSLVMEAARRADDWEQIRRHLPSESELYVIPPARRTELAGNAEDEVLAHVAPLLDGTLTLGQVIARVPYSRFEACRTIAELIAEKRARPLDSAKAVEQTDSHLQPADAIACLRSVLEREPNNREVIAKLAYLYEKEGNAEEAAKSHKLLAVSYLESGENEEAVRHLERSLELNPKDLVTWGKLWSSILQRADHDEILALGRRIVAHFGELGLTEVVRDYLLQLVKIFPNRPQFRLQLADALYALGTHDEAVAVLEEFGQAALRRERYDVAETAFKKIVQFDRDNAKAQEIVENLQSGRLERTREIRHRILRSIVAAALVIVGTAAIGWEMWVRGELFGATRSVFADSLLENRRYDEAIERIREVEERYPYSLTSLLEVPALIETLEEKAAAARTEQRARNAPRER